MPEFLESNIDPNVESSPERNGHSNHHHAHLQVPSPAGSSSSSSAHAPSSSGSPAGSSPAGSSPPVSSPEVPEAQLPSPADSNPEEPVEMAELHVAEAPEEEVGIQDTLSSAKANTSASSSGKAADSDTSVLTDLSTMSEASPEPPKNEESQSSSVASGKTSEYSPDTVEKESQSPSDTSEKTSESSPEPVPNEGQDSSESQEMTAHSSNAVGKEGQSSSKNTGNVSGATAAEKVQEAGSDISKDLASFQGKMVLLKALLAKTNDTASELESSADALVKHVKSDEPQATSSSADQDKSKTADSSKDSKADSDMTTKNAAKSVAGASKCDSDVPQDSCPAVKGPQASTEPESAMDCNVPSREASSDDSKMETDQSADLSSVGTEVPSVSKDDSSEVASSIDISEDATVSQDKADAAAEFQDKATADDAAMKHEDAASVPEAAKKRKDVDPSDSDQAKKRMKSEEE